MVINMSYNLILILKAIIYGIVQGITEWLPISSTGHMIVLDDLLNIEKDLGKSFFDLFLIVVQFGSALALVNIYFKRLWPFTKDKQENKTRINTLLYIMIGIFPAGIIGILFGDIIDTYLYNTLTVSLCLIIYGIIFLIIKEKKNTKINLKISIGIGLFQALALIPGTSRSGICIIGGLLLGLSMVDSTEFSFYLSLPIISLASFFKIYEYLKIYTIDLYQLSFLLIGTITSYLISIIVIKYLLDYIKNHDFKVFGLYRILFGTFLLICYIRGLL